MNPLGRIRELRALLREGGASIRRARVSVAALILLTMLWGLLFGLALGHWRSSPGPYIRALSMRGAWIRAPGPPSYAGYFRRHVRIAGPVKHAWVAVAPREGFEICVNQNPCGRFYLWRPTRPFQTGLSEGGQHLNPSPPALALNFPREYQWTSHRNELLPVFLDITQQFKPGDNVIAVEIETRQAPAMFRMDGEVLLWTGERIRLDTDSAWLAEPVPPFDDQYDWTERKYSDILWRKAINASQSGETTPSLHFQSFDTRVITTPFTGRWVRSEEAQANDAVWFEGLWNLPAVPDDAWIRLAANRTYDLFINERRVRVPLLGNPDMDSGDWVLGTPRGADLPAAPELLDPDEVGSMFVGDRFESPRHGDPSGLAFKPREDVMLMTRDKARATTRSDLPGTYDPIKAEGQDVMPHDAVPAQPEQHQAKSLGRDRAIGCLASYNVRSMLVAGRNTIRIHMPPPLSPEGFEWAPQLAIDGEARFRDGSRSRIATEPPAHWTARVQAFTGVCGPARPVVMMGPALTPGKPWMANVYRGIAHDPSLILHQKVQWVLGSMGISAILVGLLLWANDSRARARGEPTWPALDAAARQVGRFLLPPVSVLLAALLVESAWAERHEYMVFRLPRVWPFVFLLAAVSPLLIGSPARAVGDWLVRLPRTKLWWLLLGGLLVLCGVLRCYKLDFQPLDDDEYASCQAVVAIAQTGAPGFVAEGVYYTRSPAYHYLVGAIVWLFGANLWSMRVPSALFGVGTALLIYRLADRLLHRPWVGLGAMFLFVIHPFAIFSAHLVRFYQQQQFFALLTVYWFCEGFLSQPCEKRRYLTVVAFLLAVLSQEISAIIIFQLALGLIWMGREGGWKMNIRLMVVLGLALFFIVLDLLVFQTRCLTRTEGVSPNIEASIKPHFWDPYNLISLFLGYSRLHVAPSLIVLLALPLLVRRGGRVIWALLFFTASGIILTNLLVTHVSLRYQYWMIPLLLLLAFRGLGLLAERMAAATRSHEECDVRGRAAVLCLPIVLALFLAWSPWRIVESYDCKILNDSTGAFRYVRGQLRPGDSIAANEPHPHAAYLETGRVDYDLSVPLLQDFVMLQKGRLIDRNGGAETIASLDDLLAACRKHERLWIVVNREKFRTRGKNIRWEYPAARIELFLRRNCQIAHRRYLWTVYLWDRSRGQYRRFRE